jgi:hypothetical protein
MQCHDHRVGLRRPPRAERQNKAVVRLPVRLVNDGWLRRTWSRRETFGHTTLHQQGGGNG